MADTKYYHKAGPALPFMRTDPAKPFAPQVKNAVVIEEVIIKRKPKDNRPPLVFSALYLEGNTVIAKTKEKVKIGTPTELNG